MQTVQLLCTVMQELTSAGTHFGSLYVGWQRVSSRMQSDHGVSLISHLHLGSVLRIIGSISPLPIMPSWRGRKQFTFTFIEMELHSTWHESVAVVAFLRLYSYEKEGGGVWGIRHHLVNNILGECVNFYGIKYVNCWRIFQPC
jgi:hypothetical protein